jgi:hypothetical protein
MCDSTNSYTPAWIHLVLVMIISAVACGPVSRVEPAVGDRPEMVDKITGSWDEAELLRGVQKLAASFVRAWRDGEYAAAWEILSPAWRKQFAAIAGEREPMDLFAKGRLPRSEGAIPWDPVVTLFGARLSHFTLPTEEMGVQAISGVLLVYAVQDDGTWTAFRTVTISGARYIEPIGVLGQGRATSWPD